MYKGNSKIFYGWYIVLVAFIGNFISTGTGFYIFNAFMEPLCSQRGWTRTDINIAPMIGWATILLCSLIYGTLVVRIGPRLLMTVGSVVSAAAFIMLGRVHEIWMFYIFFILLFIGNGAVGGIVANTAVSNWFVVKRGSALGMATAGISLSGAILPYAAMIILESTDLLHAFQWIGIAILFMTPIAWLMLRNRPEDHDLLPDGVKFNTDKEGEGVLLSSTDLISERDKQSSGVRGQGIVLWTPSMMIRVQAFWKVGIAYGLVLMGVVGVMFQLKPRFSDIGFDGRTAMIMMAATALVGTAGKYIWGMLCDRFDPRRVVAVLIIATAFGLSLSLVQGSFTAVLLFIIIFGFAMGGVMSTFPIIIADLFGRESFPLVTRFLGLLLGINISGYLIMGQSFDRTGSYNIAYVIFILVDVFAAFLILTVKRPRISH